MDEFIIELKRIKFFSFHGLFEEEKATGGEFVVDLSVKFLSDISIQNIDQTIHYALLYALLKEEMSRPRDLLETLAQSLAGKISASFLQIKEIGISIEKTNPPFENFSGAVRVSLVRKF